MWLRWPLAALVVVGAVYGGLRIPEPSLSRAGGQFGGLVEPDSPAIRTQIEVIEEFRLPFLSRNAIVLRNPDGLPGSFQTQFGLRTAQLNIRGLEGMPDVEGALPISNTFGFLSSASETDTTVVLYLFFAPDVSGFARLDQARTFVDHHLDVPPGTFAGVTGAFPASEEQNRLIEESLPLVDLAVLGLVGLIVLVIFRSLVAPVVALAAVAASYLATLWALDALAAAGVTLPVQLEPLVIVLLVGLATDYTIFYLSSFRNELRRGRSPHDAVRESVRVVTPLVLAASASTAVGTGALFVARLGLFSSLGPGLAVTAVATALASIVVVPVVMSVLGRATFAPGRGVISGSVREGSRFGWGSRAGRPVAAVLLVAGGAGLVVGSAPLRDAELGVNLVEGLPDDSEPARALHEAAAGFTPGVIAPTEILVEAPGVAQRSDQLEAFQDLLEDEPGVAGVVGPEQQPTPVELGIFKADSGDAARYVLVLDASPYGSGAIELVDDLRDRAPALLAEAGLPEASAAFTGDTVISADIVETTTRDLVRIGIAALAANFVVLLLFLRAVPAALLLLGASLLTALFALGATTWFFAEVVGEPSLTFFVPFAVAVLVLALGADYNVYVVGRIWDEASRRPLPEAISVGARQASKAVGAAGLILASSFGLLALVPVLSFRQFAFAMGVGILVDTFVVRTVLVPAGLRLMGRFGQWPRKTWHDGAAGPGGDAPSPGDERGQPGSGAPVSGGDEPSAPGGASSDAEMQRERSTRTAASRASER